MEEQKSKQELFNEDPDKFIDIRDLVIALMRTDKGPAVYINPKSRAELIQAKGELEVKVLEQILAVDAEVAKNKIVKPSGSIMNFVRNKKR